MIIDWLRSIMPRWLNDFIWSIDPDLGVDLVFWSYVVVVLLVVPILFRRGWIIWTYRRVRDGYAAYRLIVASWLTVITLTFAWRALIWWDYGQAQSQQLLGSFRDRWPVEFLIGVVIDVLLGATCYLYWQVSKRGPDEDDLPATHIAK